MAARIDDDFMTAEHGGRVIATAQFSSHAAADGQGAWIDSDHPSRLFTRNQAIIRSGVAQYAVTFPDRVARLRTLARRRWADRRQHEAQREIEQPEESGMLVDPCRSVLTESSRWISKITRSLTSGSH